MGTLAVLFTSRCTSEGGAFNAIPNAEPHRVNYRYYGVQ